MSSPWIDCTFINKFIFEGTAFGAPSSQRRSAGVLDYYGLLASSCRINAIIRNWQWNIAHCNQHRVGELSQLRLRNVTILIMKPPQFFDLLILKRQFYWYLTLLNAFLLPEASLLKVKVSKWIRYIRIIIKLDVLPFHLMTRHFIHLNESIKSSCSTGLSPSCCSNTSENTVLLYNFRLKIGKSRLSAEYSSYT